MSAVWDFIHGNVTNVLILILSLLSIFDLLDMYGIEVKLFNYSKSRRRKEREDVISTIEEYLDCEQMLIRSNTQQYIDFALMEMGLKPAQKEELFAKIHDLKNANCPIQSVSDMEKQLRDLLSHKKVVVYLDRADKNRHVIYPDLKYYINLNDAIYDNIIRNQVVRIFQFYINTVLGEHMLSIHDIDGIVIPTESNVLLEIEVAKLLEVQPIIMLNKARRIYEDQYWNGTIQDGDRLIIIHDVIYSGDNIVNCIEHLPRSCSIVGVISLFNRTDIYKEKMGRALIGKTGVPVHCAMDIDDNLIEQLKE